MTSFVDFKLPECAVKKDDSLLKFRLGSGVDANLKKSHGSAKLHAAVKYINKFSWDFTADVNVKYNKETTRLHFAIKSSADVKILKNLLDAGADVNAKDNNAATPLYLAVTSENSRPITKLLLDAGADPKIKSPEGHDLLHIAVRDSKISIIKLLLNAGADVDVKNSSQLTPLQVAVRSKNLKMSKILVKAGANVNVAVMSTPLLDATKSDNLTLIRFLISAKADVNAKQADGKTPLHIAAYGSKKINVLEVLIKSGSDVNARDHDGNTPLMYAIAQHNFDYTELLIKAGACLKVENAQKMTPLQMASCSINCDIMRYLLKVGADPNELVRFKDYTSFVFLTKSLTLLNKNEDPCLMMETVRFIIERIDVNLIDKAGNSILDTIFESKLPHKEYIGNCVIKHVAKLIILGLDVSKKLFHDSTGPYFLDCLDELTLARNKKLSNVTFLDLVVQDSYELMHNVGVGDLITHFKQNIQRFYYYKAEMKSSIMDAINKRQAFQEAAICLSRHLPLLKDRHSIIRDIIGVLSSEDWELLSERERFTQCEALMLSTNFFPQVRMNKV